MSTNRLNHDLVWSTLQATDEGRRQSLELALRLSAATTRAEVAQLWAEAVQALVGWSGIQIDIEHAQTGQVTRVLALQAGAPRADHAHTRPDDAARRPPVMRIESTFMISRGAALVHLWLSRDRAFTAPERLLVAGISEHGRRAMERTDAHERLRDEYRRTTVLGRLAQHLSLRLSPHEAGQLIADIADELIGWDGCYFDLYDAASDTIREMINIDTIGATRQPVPGRHTSGPPSRLERRLLAEGGFILEQDVDVPSEYALFGDESRPSASMMFVPARHRGNVVAFFSIQSYTPRAYAPDDLCLLQTLADHGAGALARIWSEMRQDVEPARQAPAVELQRGHSPR